MKKASISEYELLKEYFVGIRTHSVGCKYNLLECSKQLMDDFIDCIEDNRLVMTDYELEKYNKRLDTIKKLFDHTVFINSFAESEITRFSREIDAISNKNDNEPIN